MIIKTPNEKLNKDLGGGIQGPGVVLIFGDQKVGKTDILLSLAKYAESRGQRVSLLSPENRGLSYKSINFYDQHSMVKDVFHSTDVVFVDDYDLSGRDLKTIYYNSYLSQVPVIVTHSYLTIGWENMDVPYLMFRAELINGKHYIEARQFDHSLPLLGKYYEIFFDPSKGKPGDDHAGMIYNEYNKTWSFGII